MCLGAGGAEGVRGEDGGRAAATHRQGGGNHAAPRKDRPT